MAVDPRKEHHDDDDDDDDGDDGDDDDDDVRNTQGDPNREPHHTTGGAEGPRADRTTPHHSGGGIQADSNPKYNTAPQGRGGGGGGPAALGSDTGPYM